MAVLAARLYGPGDIRVEEVPRPEPGPGEVLVRVKEAGICGTDKAFYKGTYRPGKLPIIPGHEVAGVVEEVGEGVDESWVGARVTSEINFPCGKCWFCRHGMYTHCSYRRVLGITVDGGFAEYFVAPVDALHRIDGLTWAQGAYVEPLAAVVEMIQMQPPPEGGRVAVVGTGNMGLLSIQVLRLHAPQVLVAVTRPGSPKATLAKRLGADIVTDTGGVERVMKEITPEGAGFDYVVETTGSPQGLDLAVKLVRPRGVIAAKSTHGAPVSFNYTELVVKEARMVGSRCGPFEPAIRLIREGLVSVDSLITSRFRLEEAVEAMETSFSRDQIKVHFLIS